MMHQFFGILVIFLLTPVGMRELCCKAPMFNAQYTQKPEPSESNFSFATYEYVMSQISCIPFQNWGFGNWVNYLQYELNECMKSGATPMVVHEKSRIDLLRYFQPTNGLVFAKLSVVFLVQTK